MAERPRFVRSVGQKALTRLAPLTFPRLVHQPPALGGPTHPAWFVVSENLAV